MSMHLPIVECRGITKSFGIGQQRVQVLRGVDFKAARGEMTFLVGPSGCGKTTLISIVGGILPRDGGELDVGGHDLGKLPSSKQSAFRLKNVGFIFQQYNLLPALTARENAAVPLIAAGVPSRAAHARAGELLDRLGLGSQMHKFPAQLSGGQQQRVAIARALIHEPKLIICDEPTASLDAHTGQTVMAMLKESAVHADRAVIIVTHDHRIYDFADRIAHMEDGVVTHVEA